MIEETLSKAFRLYFITKILTIGLQALVKIEVAPDKLEKLQKDLENNFLSRHTKSNRISQLTGSRLVCRGIPDYCLIYDLDGATNVERYCSACLEKEKVRKY